jgi:hypothetical protein
MTDIQKRLERQAAAREEGGDIFYDAADEIARLREAVEDLMAADDYWLRGNKDNQWASMMASARAKARVALGKDRQ